MEHELIISFPDQSANFCYGYEAGIIWGKMEINAPGIFVTIHKTNVELIKQMAINKNYVFQIKQYRDFEYADCVLIKSTINNN